MKTRSLTLWFALPAVVLLAGCAAQHKPEATFAPVPNSGQREAQLEQRLTQLEKQVQQLAQVVEPIKAQQAAEKRRLALREKFQQKMTQDQSKYSQNQLREAEQLYQVANQKWGTPEATESLRNMIEKYPDINRTGCAVLYVAQNSQGPERAKYLQECIDKHNDCFYGDGVQVGAYARFLLAEDYRNAGDDKKAQALYQELKAQYPDAVDHSGKLLLESTKVESK